LDYRKNIANIVGGKFHICPRENILKKKPPCHCGRMAMPKVDGWFFLRRKY